MNKVNCLYCGKEVYKKPSQIKNSKNGRFYCNSTCQYAHRKQLKKEQLERKIGQNLKDFLIQKYIIEKKTTTWLMDKLEISSHYITDLLREYNIKARTPAEQYKIWWSSLSKDEKEEYIEELSLRNTKHLNDKINRDKLKIVMGSKEYKDKISKANSGTNNGMYDPTLNKEHRIQTRALFGYKKWAKKVKERDGFICQRCSKKGNTKNLHAHHINDYYENEDGRMDLDNAITLCSSCHSKFHNRYKDMPATRDLLNEFMKI